jgi:phenylacetate-CoA ligase
MLHRKMFILAHQLGDTSFYPTYKTLVKNQRRPYDELKREQEKHLRAMVKFAYLNAPYYHELFKGLGLAPDDVRTVTDLERLPILTKDIIKRRWEEFKPANLSSMSYSEQATGGSSGSPLRYRLSSRDRFLGAAVLYRGWGYGGYEPGDRMVFLAGSSLDISTKSLLVKKADEAARNLKRLSSFDMGEREMSEYAKVVNSFKPRFIRGYASSICFFAQWLMDTHTSVNSPQGVFTTAEKLLPRMRRTIGEAFDCEVYDTYGLNDGGVSAFECPEHSGMHIDTERGLMEIVDNEGQQVDRGEGRILATSLHNLAMPFIRYETGDIGNLAGDPCGCGRGYPLLKEVIGRQQEMLITPEGKHIHGEYFTHIFWEIPHVKEFQIVQKRVDSLIIYIVPEEGFNEKDLERVRSVIRSRSEGWSVQFQCVDSIDRSSAGKYKFVISEIQHV